MDNTSNKMIVVLVMSVATICAFLLVLLGTYYAPVSANVYISNLPNASQFDQLKNNSIFKVTGLQEEDQYMCPKVYIIRTQTEHVQLWNHNKVGDQVKDYLRSIGLNITQKCWD